MANSKENFIIESNNLPDDTQPKSMSVKDIERLDHFSRIRIINSLSVKDLKELYLSQKRALLKRIFRPLDKLILSTEQVKILLHAFTPHQIRIMNVLYRLQLFRGLTQEEKSRLNEQQLFALFSIYAADLEVLNISDRKKLIEWLSFDEIKKFSPVHRHTLINVDSNDHLLQMISSTEKRNFFLGELTPDRIRRMGKAYRYNLYLSLSQEDKNRLSKKQVYALIGKAMYKELSNVKK